MKKACAVLSMCFMILLTACGGFSRCAWADESRPASQPREQVVLGKCLVIPPVGRYGRAAVYTDAVEARLTSGQPFAPKAGDTVNLPDGTSRTWQAIDADQNGRLKHAALKGGYAYIPLNVRAETPKVMLLAATGHGMVYVNGEPRAGDPYRTGYVWLPVLLKPGRNDLLFHCVRGELVAKLVSADAPALLNVADATLPDLIIGQAVRTLGAAVVINATTAPLNDLFIRADRKSVV